MNFIKIIISINNKWQLFASHLMKFFLRLNGANIGRNTFISISSRIVGSEIIIGNDCIVKKNAYIKVNKIQIGNGCIISEDDYITGSANIFIGDKSFLGKKVRINVSRDVNIGNDVGIGENSVIWTHGYFPPADEGYPITYAPVFIKDKVWVSTNIIILPGVTIGENVIVGAGSVVTKSIPENVVVAGNPAKVIKKVSEILKERKFLDILEDIFDKYFANDKAEKVKEKNFIIYTYLNYKIYIIEKEFAYSFSEISKRNSIFLYKGVSKDLESKILDYEWFNFDERIQKRTKNKEVLKIQDFLRGFGIRFIKQ